MGTFAYFPAGAYLSGASSLAGQIDALAAAITLVAVVFTVLIFAAIIFLSARYRRGAKVDRSNAPSHNNLVEFTWTVIPLIIALGIFAWASIIFFRIVRVPAGAMEISVVGKQWMWKIQQPNGRWENNELHVPVGRPIQLTMTSEDVIHAFFVPAFRLKRDVIPGQFTKMWFTPTKVGQYHLFCAEFCGTLHSTMVGTVHVMEPADYERWLAEGKTSESVAAEGERLFRKHGCNGCHSANSSVRAPILDGIYNRAVAVQIPRAGQRLEDTKATTVIADLRYIHDSIMLPEKEVAAGFRPIMPTYQKRITEEEILKIVAYIRSLGAERSSDTQRNDNSGRMTAEDYKARTGFVPENLGDIQRMSGGGSTSRAGAATGAGSGAQNSGSAEGTAGRSPGAGSSNPGSGVGSSPAGGSSQGAPNRTGGALGSPNH